jgi:hypothetical protein
VVGCGVKRDSGLDESRGTLACRAKSTNGSPVSRPLHPEGGRDGMQKETKTSSGTTIRCSCSVEK